MEPGGSLPHSKVPATCPYPEQEMDSRMYTVKMNPITFTRCKLSYFFQLTVKVSIKEKAGHSDHEVSGVSLRPLACGLWVLISTGARMSVSRQCCVWSRRGPCVGTITRPEESY
jgi:hypothetical protein